MLVTEAFYIVEEFWLPSAFKVSMVLICLICSLQVVYFSFLSFSFVSPGVFFDEIFITLEVSSPTWAEIFLTRLSCAQCNRKNTFMCLAGSFQCDTGKQEFALLSHLAFS